MRNLTLGQRAAFLEELAEALGRGELTLGQGVRKLRVELLGVDQETFARIGSVSVRTLKNLEADRGNPTLATLDGVLRPFGLKMGVVRVVRPGRGGA